MTANSSDRNIKPPLSSGVLGTKDPAALAELAAHITAVGAVPWIGFQANGIIEYGPQNSSPYAATLTNLGGDQFRLDAQEAKGLTSVRIHGRAGKVQVGDQAVSAIPTEAALAGLFPFEVLRQPLIKATTISVLDRGMVLVGGRQLHCIGIERSGTGRIPLTKLRETLVTDFYFDPDTHLLLKSITMLPVDLIGKHKLLDVVSYGDYRLSGASLIPYSFTETLEGERSLKLQLTDVHLSPTLSATYFEF